MTSFTERWRPVVGWENFYEVSNEGRVRSCHRWIPGVNRDGTARISRFKSRVLKGTKDRDGYLKVNLRNGLGGVKTRMIHCLVAEAFLGTRPKGQVICHFPDSSWNNSASNLRYDTYSENERDKRRSA